MGRNRKEATLRALQWGLIGLCWNSRKGSFDAGIPRSTVIRLERAGLLRQDGYFYRITPSGRRALAAEGWR